MKAMRKFTIKIATIYKITTFIKMQCLIGDVIIKKRSMGIEVIDANNTHVIKMIEERAIRSKEILREIFEAKLSKHHETTGN